jgi:hypothetical protein
LLIIPVWKSRVRRGVEGTMWPAHLVGTGDSWGIFMDGDTVSRAVAASPWDMATREGWGSWITPAETPLAKAALSLARGGLAPRP